MSEKVKVQHILRGLRPALIEKVFPTLTPNSDSKELLRQIQVHSQASLMATRSSSAIPTLAIQTGFEPMSGSSMTNFVTKNELAEAMKGLKRDVTHEVAETLNDFQSKIANSLASTVKIAIRDELGSKGDTRHNNVKPDQRKADFGRNKRTHDGQPICNTCGRPGHIQRNCRACHKCGRVGHIARFCQQTASGANEERVGARQTNTPKHVEGGSARSNAVQLN